MIMRGDLDQIIDKINPVFETAFNRIEALDERIKELEAKLESVEAQEKRPVGRPKKNN